MTIYLLDLRNSKLVCLHTSLENILPPNNHISYCLCLCLFLSKNLPTLEILDPHLNGTLSSIYHFCHSFFILALLFDWVPVSAVNFHVWWVLDRVSILTNCFRRQMVSIVRNETKVLHHGDFQSLNTESGWWELVWVCFLIRRPWVEIT